MVSNHETKSWFQHSAHKCRSHSRWARVSQTLTPLSWPEQFLVAVLFELLRWAPGKGSSKALTEFRGQGSSHWANSGEALAGLAQFSGSICSVWSNSEELVLAQTMRISRIRWVCLVPREQIMKPNHETKSRNQIMKYFIFRQIMINPNLS